MRKKLRETDSVSYWKSMVDVITVLMMVILLVLMFFVLNFLANKNEFEFDNDDYDGYGAFDHAGAEYTVTLTPSPSPTPYEHDDDNGGGGGGSETSATTSETTVEIPEEEGIEDSTKAAIYVVLVDGETGQTIEVPDIAFQLFSASGNRMTLSTHYPELISYSEFTTTIDGTFYLPEKINLGTYYLHQMTEVPGYDFSTDISFEVEKSYDWESPLIVRIPLGVAKNNIQVQINSANTGLGLPEVVFDVVANGDVITPDGTIRYRNGELATTIHCDETGYGLSEEIYLGNYTLIPRNLPFGYAAPELSSRQIELTRRTQAGTYAPLVVMDSYITTVRVTVRDEFSDTSYLPSVTYQLTCIDDSSETRQFVTNTAGYFEIKDLKKNAIYRLEEIDIPRGYLPNESAIEFTVDSMGYIESSYVYQLDLSNRMIRIEVAAVDRILRIPLMGENISLLDANGNELYNWNSTVGSYSISGIEPGVYTLRVTENGEHTTILVNDSKDIQKYSISVMTFRSYVLLAGASVALILMIILIFVIIVPKIANKRRTKKYGDKYGKQ